MNTGTREASGDVMAALRELTKAPVRYIINTNGDADALGGNATFNAPTVLHIAAHENALKLVSAPSGPDLTAPS